MILKISQNATNCLVSSLNCLFVGLVFHRRENKNHKQKSMLAQQKMLPFETDGYSIIPRVKTESKLKIWTKLVRNRTVTHSRSSSNTYPPAAAAFRPAMTVRRMFQTEPDSLYLHWTRCYAERIMVTGKKGRDSHSYDEEERKKGWNHALVLWGPPKGWRWP